MDQKEIIQNLCKKRLKIINNIPSGQKQKKKYTESIPYCNDAGYVLKNEAVIYNINAPIQPELNIYQI